MKKSFSLIAALAFAALAGPVHAQEATNPAADLDMGQVDGEMPAGAPYIKEQFGDWALRCLNNPEGDDPCQLYQLLMDGEGNSVAEISMFLLPEGGQAAAGATIMTPLGTLLTEGLMISVDGASPRRYVYTFCNVNGCAARVGFTAEELAHFKGGTSAVVRLVSAANPGQPVMLNMSLKGFTAGIESPLVQGAAN
jgi:invasion protein IalB